MKLDYWVSAYRCQMGHAHRTQQAADACVKKAMVNSGRNGKT